MKKMMINKRYEEWVMIVKELKIWTDDLSKWVEKVFLKFFGILFKKDIDKKMGKYIFLMIKNGYKESLVDCLLLKYWLLLKMYNFFVFFLFILWIIF